VSDAHRLVAVILEVADLARSAQLYRDGFGVDLHWSEHAADDRWIGGRHAACSWTDGFLHFALYPVRGDAPTTGVQIGFAVADLDEAHRRAVAAGAAVLHEATEQPWGISARYRDFDGNVVELTQHA
jgi:predicted enzyme related to lactoylglutathione lyase